jgi:hypothetical protein
MTKEQRLAMTEKQVEKKIAKKKVEIASSLRSS